MLVLSRSVVFDPLQPPWTVAGLAPPSMGFSRQEYWSGLSFPPSEDLPNPEIKPVSLTFPALAVGFFTTSATGGCDLPSPNPVTWEKTLEGPLDSKEIKPVNPKGNQP